MTSQPLSGCTIVFDLDGTIAETAPDLIKPVNVLLTHAGLKPTQLQDLRGFVGKGAKVMLESAAAAQGHTFDRDQMRALVSRFIELYELDISSDSYLYPGFVEALDLLEEQGAEFAVCTNKFTKLAIKVLEGLKVLDRFKAVIGADSVENKKPHADHYLHTLDKAGGDLRRSLMIGDTASDSGAARNAGAPVILVDFGYCDTAPEELSPDAVISHYSELPGLARRLLAKDD